MALISQSRPADQSLSHIIAPGNVSATSKDKKIKATTWGFQDNQAPDRGMNGKKVKNKGSRHRISDTSGNVTAGGVGSGRKKEVEKYLKSQGFQKSAVRGTTSGDSPNGSSHWQKSIESNMHGTAHASGVVLHAVMVQPDGSWIHSVTGNHRGHPSDIRSIHLTAAGGITGKSLESLKIILARAFKESTRKSLAKKGDALKDGSFPIANKKDLANAKQAIGRSKNPAAAKRLINKRAKQLGAGALGPGLTAKKKKKLKAKNEDAIEFYSKKKIKALGEDDLNNKKINKWMKQQSASGILTVKASDGTITIKSGGQGSGRHITVTTHNFKELSKMHDGLVKQGFKMNDKDNRIYKHKNGDKVTMNYSAGGTGSGRKAGLALGKMLRRALINRLAPAISIADKGNHLKMGRFAN